MEIIFITRTDKEGYVKCIKWLKRIKKKNNGNITDFIIICPDKGIDRRVAEKNKFTLLESDNSTSPISFNLALEQLRRDEKEPEALLFASKEIVELTKNNKINKLYEELRVQENKILVVGYKFTHKDKSLKNEINNYYSKRGVAYMVPWNTCALWNYRLFKENVRKFDKICYQDPIPKLRIKVNNKEIEMKLKGMEDGLAIAEAAFFDANIKYKLLDSPINWEIDKDKIEDHKNKLKRKDIVLTVFINMREYSFDALMNAKLDK